MSHYSNCSWTPVPPGHSLFQFLLVYLAAPSPLSPSALTFCPAPSNSSLTYYQTAFLAPFHSVCQMDKPHLCIGGESNTPGPFLNLSPPKSISVLGPWDMMLHSRNLTPLSQPLLQMEPVTFTHRVNHLPAG